MLQSYSKANTHRLHPQEHQDEGDTDTVSGFNIVADQDKNTSAAQIPG